MAIEIRAASDRRRLPRLRRRAASKVREEAHRGRRRARLARYVSAFLLLVSCAALVAFVYLYRSYSKIVDERIASGYLTSRAGLYAAPRVLRPGQSVARERLVEILRRAGYVDDAGESSVWSGSFTAGEDYVEILPRRTGVAESSSPFDVVRVEFAGGRIKSVTGDGRAIDSFRLEPEALSTDSSMKTGGRAALSFQDIPDTLKQAVLSIEDRRFFEHKGVDGVGILRAALSWGDRDQDLKQGGSTITQQLVKNTYLTPERTLRRKMSEAILASALERRLSKEDIFALYCNEIYLGRRGSLAVRGVEQAARVFFGKRLKELSLAESATIAGMIQSPARYAPDRHPERARARRNTVIDAMLRDGVVTKEQADAASNAPVETVPAEGAHATAPYFIDYVNRASESSDGAQDVRVYTTIDLDLQQRAEQAVGRQLARLEKIYKGKRRPQAALVALDPRTGHILAMVGGSSYAESQLNRASDARRQPGSVFKPLVYAAAVEGGLSPVSLSTDAPREFTYDFRSKYRPANYGGGYTGRDVTLRTGLVRSLNVVTVDVAMRAGLQNVAALAERMGLPKPAPYPALALGTTEATPLEVASVYAAFANGGTLVRPTAVARTEDASDASDTLEHVSAARQVVKPSTAYIITDMLSSVVTEGTGRAARGALGRVAFAGKTGTSRDGWFAGYTPNLVCVVWIGFDDGEQLGLTGADSALPLWVEFMREAVELRPELGGERFARPASVSTVEVDAETGLLAGPGCTHRERVALTPALVPSASCFAHEEASQLLADSDGSDIYGSTYVAAEVQTVGEHAAVEGDGETHADDAAETDVSASLKNDSTTPTRRPAAVPPRPALKVETNGRGRQVLTNDVRLSATLDGGGEERER
ncbi:MAG TPA: PBP1A family penicillin-binding protein [Pyrinomonadaceae bacterium]|nr:PBP1A family penicillin-binding protein [Pyrinomonadaceae bacterium]